jgi:hypothetical protein
LSYLSRSICGVKKPWAKRSLNCRRRVGKTILSRLKPNPPPHSARRGVSKLSRLVVGVCVCVCVSNLEAGSSTCHNDKTVCRHTD